MPKAKKDPNKPKGVKSAYIFFVEEQRAEHDQNGEQLSFSELSKKCGALWADMDDEDKAPFVKLSDKDRKRHQREMENYVPPEADSDSDSEDERPKKKKKKVKDPNAPKRPITAYFYFAADKRPEIKKENPDYGITQIAQVIGEHWRNLDDEDKHPFEELAAKDKARYVKEMAAYNKR
jgi:hypothetical protein